MAGPGNPYQYTGRGEGFLTDYSNLGAVGSGIEGFTEAFQNAQDRKMKMLEHQANLEATKQKIQREKDQSALEAWKSHASIDNGQITARPLTDDEKYLESAKSNVEGVMPDPGDPTKAIIDPHSIGKAKIDAQNGWKGQAAHDRQDRMDRNEHEKVIARLNTNPIAKQRLSQFQGLDNALAMITSVDKLTPQAIQEFQQALRTQVTAAQKSGVAERAEDYYHSMGLNSAKWMQFMTGDPASLSKDSELVKHLVNSAKVEQGNVQKQARNAMSAATSGHESMYKRRPDLFSDLGTALSQHSQQFQNQTPSQPTVGLVKPEEEGFLSRLGGLILGSQAKASGKPKQVRQNGTLFQLNSSGEYEEVK